MIRPRRRRLAFTRTLLLATLGCLAGLVPAPRAFVFLDTSAAPDTVRDGSGRGDTARAAPSPTPPAAPAAAPPAPPAAAPVPPAPAAAPADGVTEAIPPAPASAGPASAGLRRPHYRSVLFLSADDMLVYSHLGVLKALEEFRLGVDMVVVEGRSTLVGAAWALGYPLPEFEARLLGSPIERYLQPMRTGEGPLPRFAPYGPDPVQVEIPLGIQSLQAPQLHWSGSPRREDDEFLHLSWMIAKLTHDAPGGPVEDLQELPRPMAVQVLDLQEERAKVIREGSLQAILKAGLLPRDVVHARRRLWPFAPGDLVSGQAAMLDRLPFTFDRLVVVQPGRRLRPPALEERTDAWRDSLSRRARTPPSEEGPASGKVVRIELNPGAGFATWDRDPRAWVDLGHTSALRSMDMLMTVLGRRDSAAAQARAADPRPLPPPLGLNRLTVNPLASGGRQLLQDILRRSVGEREDSTGEGPIADLVGSGYYSGLDVEWTRSPGEEVPALVFDALERSRLLLRAGANVANSGEDLPDRGPEILAGVTWSEPFYVPIRAEADLLLGGRRPGFAVRGLMAPVSPLPLELGVGMKDWRIRYPAPTGTDLELDPRSFRLNRTRSDIFLNLLPAPGFRTGTAIQWHNMRYPGWDDMRFPGEKEMERLLEPVTGTGKYESVDFEQTLFLGAGGKGPSGLHRHSLWARYRNLNRVNLLGAVRNSSSGVETRVRASLGDFRFMDQYYWSNLDSDDPGLFEFMEAGEVSAFSFQDDGFFGILRHTHFQNVQAEYAPAFGRFGLRLMAGGFRLYGHPLTEGLEFDYTRVYWEAQASYATPAGPVRLGLAGVEGDGPIFFVRAGADLDLDPDGPER